MVSALIMPRSATMHTRPMAKRRRRLNHRHQGGDIGGVSRPHFRTDWPAIAVDQYGEDHLAQIGAMIFAVTVLAD